MKSLGEEDENHYLWDVQNSYYSYSYRPSRFDYSSNLVYADSTLHSVLIDGGFIDMQGVTPQVHFFVNDHQGNVRVEATPSGTIVNKYHYAPYGETIDEVTSTDNLYRWSSKEWDETLLSYDFGARYYRPSALPFWTTMDPLCEKYPDISPYAYCAGNPVNLVDPEGEDWYKQITTGDYVWFDGNDEIEGYIYYGPLGSILGDFEYMIDSFMKETLEMKSGLYSNGFSFSLANNNKGTSNLDYSSGEAGLLWEFALNIGPQFSVFTENHPFTKALKNSKLMSSFQNDTDLFNSGNTISDTYKWGIKDVLSTRSIPLQFIGSYSYRIHRDTDKNSIFYMVFDSKSRTSLFLHMPFHNKDRKDSFLFGNTYQFYLWNTPINK